MKKYRHRNASCENIRREDLMVRKSLRIELFCQWLQIADHLMDIRHRRLIHKAKIHYSNAVMVLKKKKS